MSKTKMNLYVALGYASSVAKRIVIGEISVVSLYEYLKLYLIRRISSIYKVITKRKYPELMVSIRVCSPDEATAVDQYWGEYTVNSLPFSTRWESQKYYEWLIEEYPLLAEFMDFGKKRDNQVVLDYGCGPGNDIFRLLVLNNAKKVIGVDVSLKTLKLARQRLSLYKINPERLELIQCSDSVGSLPVDSESIDYINCVGVLHHMTKPEKILGEFFRVLKKNSTGSIMVYNQNSIFFHVYIAYLLMVIENKFSGMCVKDAFAKNTDGPNCPISRCYRPDEFISICRNTGFEVNYVGGYFHRMELHWLRKFRQKALKNESLAQEHTEFLSKLKYDERGYPKFERRHAGIGGVYKIFKR
ncbi:MAG: methyltransferase domain-containing protein [Chloroflexi bacterium]|nr:methyltransferase domain-containing protein [Chloroflexota bacterium]